MSSWLYPLYDVHGNVKATLTRSGATGYSTVNWKSYDVWGGERASTGSGSMFGYCGNLGHPTDPENGLIYMRARFYEPWTGRILSEDPSKDGFNWYAYGANAPTAFVDFTGKYILGLNIWGVFFALAGGVVQAFTSIWGEADRQLSLSGTIHNPKRYYATGAGAIVFAALAYIIGERAAESYVYLAYMAKQEGRAGTAVLAVIGYSLLIALMLRAIADFIDFEVERRFPDE